LGHHEVKRGRIWRKIYKISGCSLTLKNVKIILFSQVRSFPSSKAPKASKVKSVIARREKKAPMRKFRTRGQLITEGERG
jgi:hypothetical protein